MSVKTDALSKKAPTTTDDNKWAIAVDIKTTVHDFHKRIPDMAFKVSKSTTHHSASYHC